MASCPGFISTTQGKAGCYMPCQDTKTEIFDTAKVFYLAYHPKLRWVNTTVATVNKINNAISLILKRLGGGGWWFKFGRTCSNNLIQLGRVHYNITSFKMMNSGAYKELPQTSVIEVLVCDP